MTIGPPPPQTMPAMALATRRTTVAAGQILRNLLSLARPPATAPFRSLSTFRCHGLDIPEDSSDDGVIIVPEEEKSIPKGGGGRLTTETWEDDEGIHGRFDMPGLDKSHVKVWIERGAIFVNGEGPPARKGFNRSDVTLGRKYVRALKPRSGIWLSEVQTRMKNGTLFVLVRRWQRTESPR